MQKLNERCIDSVVGAEKAWDAIHSWLASYELDVPAGTEQALMESIERILDSTDVYEVK